MAGHRPMLMVRVGHGFWLITATQTLAYGWGIGSGYGQRISPRSWLGHTLANGWGIGLRSWLGWGICLTHDWRTRPRIWLGHKPWPMLYVRIP